jgi:ATP:ADP antiporter, AAA family
VDAAARRAVWAAGITAGLAIAFQTAGKATRDAVFLSVHPVTALPAMVVGAAGASVLLAVAAAWALTRTGPGRLVPVGFAASGVLLLAEWWLLERAGPAGAVVFYLHYAAFGAVLVSGLWSIVGERFDPRAARREISRVGAAGTMGGVVGGLVAARAGVLVPVSAMLPFLAACHFGAAAFAALAGRGIHSHAFPRGTEPIPAQIAARAPYLRLLVALVLLTTLGEVMLDYVFKARVTGALGRGEQLLQFFAWYYTGVGVLAFTLQTLAARPVLQRLGLARTVGTLPVAAAVGSGAALVAGGFGAVIAARGAEALMRASFFRTGYEMLFAPLLPAEKRATKAVLDVGVARVGDVVGAGVVRVALLGPAALQVLLGLAMLVTGVAAALVIRLQRGYSQALVRSLAARADGGLPAAEEDALQSALLHTVGAGALTLDLPTLAVSAAGATHAPHEAARAPAAGPASPTATALRSRDPGRVRASLESAALGAELVEEVIPLLAWDEVARAAIAALRHAAPDATDALVRALRDPDAEFTVRRRLPLVLSSHLSQAAVDGLQAGLADPRFEVRYRCGLALHRVREALPDVRLDRERILAAALREVSVDRRIWESHRVLDQEDDEAWSPMFDVVLRDRAGRGLQHVFTLLALVLPATPLRLAFRGLFAGDAQLRGTALEYLEATLPADIRGALWPFLEDTRPQAAARRSRNEIVDALLASEATIALDLERLRRPSTDR